MTDLVPSAADAASSPPRPPRSPLGWRQVALPVAVGLASAAAVGLRYGLQGTGNVYTNTARAFYLEDPILGWSLTRDRWVWLGLDALGLVVAVALGTLAVAWTAGALARRHRAGRGGPGLPKTALVAFWIGAFACAVTPAVPIIAFASGFPPGDAVAHMPAAAAAPSGPTTAATAVWSDLPAGAWTVTGEGASNTIVAQIAAGEETFDASFGPLAGTVTVDPTDLTLTVGTVSAPAASIDTGIALRSTHARADLKVETFTSLDLSFATLDAVTVDGAQQVRFAGTGTFTLMGAGLELPLSGTVTRLDAAARRQLGLAAAHALLVKASLEVPLVRTPLGAADFDKDTIAVTARFILAPPAAP